MSPQRSTASSEDEPFVRAEIDPLNYDSFENVQLSDEMRAELLDPEGWNEGLAAYARTVGLGVAMADCEGRVVGECHNPQATWLMVQNAKRLHGGPAKAGCSFCIESATPCRAVTTALNTGQVEMACDGAGLTHLAIPLTLGKWRLGAIIAGQVFDQYPEALTLRRLANELDVSPQTMWEHARLELPVRNATLRIYGNLLLNLGRAFLRKRYASIIERRLVQANLRLRLLLEGIKGHALFTVDEKGLVTSWNGGAERLFGFGEAAAVGKDFSTFFAPEDVQVKIPSQLLDRAKLQGAATDQGWQLRQDGTRFFGEGSLSALGKDDTLEFGRLMLDVTERRDREEAMRHAQKLESVGLLASGIAHDFNNLLTVVLGGISMATALLPADDVACIPLALATQASEKAADLTSQLLAYAGQGKFIVRSFDLSTLVRDMLRLLETAIQKTVSLELALESELPWIEADASQIQQIIMNLVINGAESMGAKGGVLRVATGQSGDEVWLEVQDYGSGMTEEVKSRIFDPFFTTKVTGRGLGLAAVSGIVSGHEGRMIVESTVGKGSTFRVCFPGVARVVQTKDTPALVADRHSSGLVLVVDDEPALRGVARNILERSGYEVLLAADGAAAVEIFRQHASEMTAILLDLTMPVLGGMDAFHQIREIRSDVPVVVSTGYSAEDTRKMFGYDAFLGFIQKPYTASRLNERIHTISESLRLTREQV